MSRHFFFAANWKMHVAPGEARTYLDRFLALDAPRPGRTIAFFPPAVSIETVARRLAAHEHCITGAQDIYWEPNGAYTGEVSVALALGAGASATLVGHSERRHLFGESDDDVHRKVRAALDGGLTVVLCVGETLKQRNAGETDAVVTRQLRSALAGVDPRADLVVAYEPVWAIGTGRTATPSDAAAVHAGARRVLADIGLPADTRILYGGSVKLDNIDGLMAESEIDGVLVGGASLDPEGWAAICAR